MIDGYVLSREADNDIEAIFAHGENKFGSTQAISYLIGLNEHFETIAKTLPLGRKEMKLKKAFTVFLTTPISSFIEK